MQNMALFYKNKFHQNFILKGAFIALGSHKKSRENSMFNVQ